MASVYDLQQAAGTVHRELSFDVDGRFVRYVGVSAAEVDGVLHLVVSLSEKADQPPATEESPPPQPTDGEGVTGDV